MPLGIAGPGSWKQCTTILEPGDTLFSFTDGLLDLYGGTLGALEKIAPLVRAADTPERLMTELASLVGAGNPQDDVTVIAIRRRTT
jgi:sigma-B regulation protein RsbU (phosphoserine phosphatase)